jgi:hypothetical protein
MAKRRRRNPWKSDDIENIVIAGAVLFSAYLIYTAVKDVQQGADSFSDWVDSAETTIGDDLNYIFNPSQWGIVQ